MAKNLAHRACAAARAGGDFLAMGRRVAGWGVRGSRLLTLVQLLRLSLATVKHFVSATAVLLATACGLLDQGKGEGPASSGSAAAESAKQERVLYYQLSGHADKGWQLTNEDNFKQLEKLVVVSSTMFGFKRGLHFDTLTPFETEHLKQEGWHLITFEQGHNAPAGKAGGEPTSPLAIRLEWLDQEGDLKKASVSVQNADVSPPSRDTFDALFSAYVRIVGEAEKAAMEKKAANTSDGKKASPKDNPAKNEKDGEPGGKDAKKKAKKKSKGKKGKRDKKAKGKE